MKTKCKPFFVLFLFLALSICLSIQGPIFNYKKFNDIPDETVDSSGNFLEPIAKIKTSGSRVLSRETVGCSKNQQLSWEFPLTGTFQRGTLILPTDEEFQLESVVPTPVYAETVGKKRVLKFQRGESLPGSILVVGTCRKDNNGLLVANFKDRSGIKFKSLSVKIASPTVRVGQPLTVAVSGALRTNVFAGLRQKAEQKIEYLYRPTVNGEITFFSAVPASFQNQLIELNVRLQNRQTGLISELIRDSVYVLPSDAPSFAEDLSIRIRQSNTEEDAVDFGVKVDNAAPGTTLFFSGRISKTVDFTQVVTVEEDGRIYAQIRKGFLRNALCKESKRVLQLKELRLTQGGSILLDSLETRVSLPEIVVDDSISLGPCAGHRSDLFMNSLRNNNDTFLLFGSPPKDLYAKREIQKHSKVFVHGYCAIDAWGSVWDDFTEPKERLEDFNQNRLNDEFAQKIIALTVAKGITGCGLIAHSQGGMASLHMYTYYWSCLDEASLGGTRLIQTLGTPYQGTSLASLAYIAEVFGISCGGNNDLTYSGATIWLSNIPSAARSKVSYVTASFDDNILLPDYCSLASLVLVDPDDGIVEKWAGQLLDGHNLGHKPGWCHDIGMEAPAMYADPVFNAELNSNIRY